MTTEDKCSCLDCVVRVKQDGDGRNLCAKCTRADCDEDGRTGCQRPDFKKPNAGGSGYTDCACRDCFDIAVSNDVHAPDMCWECKKAGCDGNGDCSRDDAYGQEEEEDDNELVAQP